MTLANWTRLLTALGVASVVPLRLEAQTPRRVQVAFVDALSEPQARAELVRFSTPGRPDLILLRTSDATPANLVAALLTYRELRDRRPTQSGAVARTTIVGAAEAAQAPIELVTRARQMLRQVSGSPTARIGNLGQGKWSEFDAVP